MKRIFSYKEILISNIFGNLKQLQEMSSVQVSKLDAATKNQLVTSYATLILASSNVPVNEENLKKVIEASGNKAEGSLVQAFAKILHGKDVTKFYACGGGAAAAPAHHDAKKDDHKKEEKKPG